MYPHKCVLNACTLRLILMIIFITINYTVFSRTVAQNQFLCLVVSLVLITLVMIRYTNNLEQLVLSLCSDKTELNCSCK